MNSTKKSIINFYVYRSVTREVTCRWLMFQTEEINKAQCRPLKVHYCNCRHVILTEHKHWIDWTSCWCKNTITNAQLFCCYTIALLHSFTSVARLGVGSVFSNKSNWLPDWTVPSHLELTYNPALCPQVCLDSVQNIFVIFKPCGTKDPLNLLGLAHSSDWAHACPYMQAWFTHSMTFKQGVFSIISSRALLFTVNLNVTTS